MRYSRFTLLAGVLLFAAGVYGQFSPDGGQPGSEALHVADATWRGWAISATFDLGLQDIALPDGGFVANPGLSAVLGPEDGAVASLGDGGVATLQFDPAIADGPGADFAVFENGFGQTDTSGFHELAFVEVSSNGVDFFRFPTTSLTALPVPSFGLLQPRQVSGFAGKYSAPYGAPFDLAELAEDPALDKQNVRFVRVVDVVGSGNPAFSTRDSEGAIVYDPYPTRFPAGGFDLDAIGVLNSDESVATKVPLLDAPLSQGLVLSEEEVSTYLAGLQVTYPRAQLFSARGQVLSRTTPLASGFYVFRLEPFGNSLRLLVY